MSLGTSSVSSLTKVQKRHGLGPVFWKPLCYLGWETLLQSFLFCLLGVGRRGWGRTGQQPESASKRDHCRDALDVADNDLQFRSESVDKAVGEGVELCEDLSWSHLAQSGDTG